MSTFAHETREIAHETSFLLLLTKRISRNEFFAPAHETSAHETSAHETSFFALLTKRVLTKRVQNSWANKLERFNWQCFLFFRHYNQYFVLTSLVSKLVSTFAHETREIAHETSFLLLLTKRVSRNEFFASAHETSAHETSFWALLTKRVLTKRVQNSWAN